jgi:hypothetical protein
MKTVTNLRLRSPRSWIAFGLLLFVLLSFQTAMAVTNYIFFSVNGDTSRTSITQGENIAWGANCAVGATLTWEIWIDLNANSVIDPASDMILATFAIADGDTSSDQGPPDTNPIPDGWYLSSPMLLGVAPENYIFKAIDQSDATSAQRTLLCNPLLSPPNMFRGQITITGVSAPNPVLENVWIEGKPQGNDDQMWGALTNDSGFYQMNISDAGTGLLFQIRPSDIPGYVTPSDEMRTVSGIIDGVNFAYSAPTDSLYGQIKDQNGTLIIRPIYVYCYPNNGGNGREVQSLNGTYKFYFGPSQYGQWNIGVNPSDVIPDYLYPNNFNFDNTIIHSLQHDLVCYTSNAVIYARVTENGNNPSHEYMVQAQSNNLQCGTMTVSGMGLSNLATLHITSLDPSGWNLGITNWNNQYPIPPGFVLDPQNQTWNRHPGDTVSLNFIYGKMIRDTVTIDPGDPNVTWDNVWVNLYRDGYGFNTQCDNNGIFTLYADTGTYSLGVSYMNYLTKPSGRTVRVTDDTIGGLGFNLNWTHCHVTGTLVNVPLPLPYSTGVSAHTESNNNGYSNWAAVDSLTGTYSIWLCDGNWNFDPPYIPGRNQPQPPSITISEMPDSARVVDFIYLDPNGIGDPNISLPADFTLLQNYPNPFNAQTTIAYGLSKEARATVEIFDLLGRKIETLLDKQQQPGYYQIIWNAGDHPSGVYFYRITAGNFVETRRMILMK